MRFFCKSIEASLTCDSSFNFLSMKAKKSSYGLKMIELDDLEESLRCKQPSVNNVIGFCSVDGVNGVGVVTAVEPSFMGH